MRVPSPTSRRRDVVADAFRTRLWPVPTLGVVAAIAAGIGTTQLDGALADSLPPTLSRWLFGGGPDAAREVLGAIAASLITVTSLTFSLTLVTLQLASSQFSPRLLRTFARDRFVQRTLALFLATFVYALTVLRTVRTGSDGEDDFVPKFSVTLAFLLAVASVIALVLFLAHLVREIRVETMLAHAHRDAVAAVRATTTEHDAGTPRPRMPEPPPDARVVPASSSGFLIHVDEAALVEAAAEASALVRVNREPGGSVIVGTPVAVAWPDEPEGVFDPDVLDTLRRKVSAAVHTGNERTQLQDVGFGIRQLTDVAVKALSPGINDPTTAVHALGHTAGLLCELADRDLDDKVLCDEDSRPRVVLQRPTFVALLDEAVSQPRRYGAADPAVLDRLFALLGEVGWRTTRDSHREAVTAQFERLQRTVAQQDFDDHERAVLDRSARDAAAALVGTWRANSHDG